MADNAYGGGHLVAAFLGGAAAGAVVALLTAPRAGRESRERVRDYIDHRRDDAARLPSAVRAAGEAARNAFGEAIHEGDRSAS